MHREEYLKRIVDANREETVKAVLSYLQDALQVTNSQDCVNFKEYGMLDDFVNFYRKMLNFNSENGY